MMTVVVVVVCMGKSLTIHEMVLALPSDPPHRHSLKKPKKNSSQLLRKQNGSSSDNTSLSYCNISIQRFQRFIKVYIPKPNFEEAPHSPHLTLDGWYSQTRSLRRHCPLRRYLIESEKYHIPSSPLVLSLIRRSVTVRSFVCLSVCSFV